MSAPRRSLLAATLLVTATALLGPACGPGVEAGAHRGVIDPTTVSPDPRGAEAGTGGGSERGTARPTPTEPPTVTTSPPSPATTPGAPADTSPTRVPGPTPTTRARGYDRGIRIAPMLTPTRPDKVAGGGARTMVTVQQNALQLTGGPAGSRFGFTADPVIAWSAMTVRFAAKGVAVAKTGVGDCAVKAGEFVCALGAMKGGTGAYIDVQTADGGKQPVTFIIEAIADNDAAYTGSFTVPLVVD